MNLPVAIETHDLTVTYRRKPVLYGVDVAIEPGQLVGILGPNGAGKSTLIKAMMGLVPTVGGWVEIFGKRGKASLKRIGYVPQREEVDWDFPVTVADVALMGTYGDLGLFRRPGAAEKGRALQALERVGMQDYAKRQIGNLSGGQQQRVFLARALAQDADLYLMDEPFAGVDAATEEAIIDVLQSMREEGKTVLVVHHDLQTARDYFDSLLMLNMRLIAYGKTADVFTPEILQQTYGGKLAILAEMADRAARKQVNKG